MGLNRPNLAQNCRKIGRNRENHIFHHSNDPYPSPFGMNGYIYLNETWDHNNRQVLGY